MFRCVDLTQLAYSVQKFSLDFLAAIGVFNSGLLPDTSKGQCTYFSRKLSIKNDLLFLVYACFLLTVEMLLLSIMGTIWFRPSQTIFFDKYKREFEEDDNIGESSLSSNEDAVMEDRSSSIPRLDHLPLRVEDVYVVDENSNYTKRTATQSTDDVEDVDNAIRSSRFI